MATASEEDRAVGFREGYQMAMERAGKATRWDSYKRGYEAGIEAAAKACEHFAEPRLNAAAWAARKCAEHIRALSPSPSATDSNKTDALPRPGEPAEPPK